MTGIGRQKAVPFKKKKKAFTALLVIFCILLSRDVLLGTAECDVPSTYAAASQQQL